ncbi:hypothetical protein AA313_de0210440 [Arthrobotrys entomopaga]|nr:hypothetical protein AA313_de0210440 [Arthrobotrys entomopaga]
MKRIKPVASIPRYYYTSPIASLRHTPCILLPWNRRHYCSSPHNSNPPSFQDVPTQTTSTTTTPTTATAAPNTNANKTLHHSLATQLDIYDVHAYSPGSPLFLPNGARIFNRLIEFLRAQYTLYGYEEVITPMIYKDKLWEQSGHLKNFRDDMFKVISGKKHQHQHQHQHQQQEEKEFEGGMGMTEGSSGEEGEGEYSLKPMNCPGHCLLYKMRSHGYTELPIRFAEFASLHRDEVRSALTGLTRVRRFHQDDAHIFCRPDQIAQEISSTLEMIDTVYSTFSLSRYKFVLSTRPENYIGTVEEWDEAEEALKGCLGKSGKEWTLNPGDGAFYGPKIDIILTDSTGKEHQTATVQLDFQLPRNFELGYQTSESGVIAKPVIIHRAVFGSLERFMALLIERYGKRWPFWISPRQVAIVPVNASDEVMEYVKKVRERLAGVSDSFVVVGEESGNVPDVGDRNMRRQELGKRTFVVDVEASGLGKGLRVAKEKGYNVIVVVGNNEVKTGTVTYDYWRGGSGGAYAKGKTSMKATVDELYELLVKMEREYAYD